MGIVDGGFSHLAIPHGHLLNPVPIAGSPDSSPLPLAALLGSRSCHVLVSLSLCAHRVRFPALERPIRSAGKQMGRQTCAFSRTGPFLGGVSYH
jgi:hypothetical protein